MLFLLSNILIKVIRKKEITPNETDQTTEGKIVIINFSSIAIEIRKAIRELTKIVLTCLEGFFTKNAKKTGKIIPEIYSE